MKFIKYILYNTAYPYNKTEYCKVGEGRFKPTYTWFSTCSTTHFFVLSPYENPPIFLFLSDGTPESGDVIHVHVMLILTLTQQDLLVIVV